jgi:hypothetical protein
MALITTLNAVLMANVINAWLDNLASNHQLRVMAHDANVGYQELASEVKYASYWHWASGQLTADEPKDVLGFSETLFRADYKKW